MITKFNKHYPDLIRALHALGDVVMTLAQAALVSLGVPLLLCLLLYVEVQRVKYGIALFEVHPDLAVLGAWALVLANLSIEFLIHYVEKKSGYEPDRAVAWSLRLVAQDMKYRLGIGSWRPRVLSPAHSQRVALRLVTFTILSLALAGSMQSVMAEQSGAWYAAALAIVTNGSLIEITTWSGGLLFTFAAVRLAQVMTSYIAQRVSETAISAAEFQGIDDDTQEVKAVELVLEPTQLPLQAGAGKKRARSPRPSAELPSIPMIEPENAPIGIVEN